MSRGGGEGYWWIRQLKTWDSAQLRTLWDWKMAQDDQSMSLLCQRNMRPQHEVVGRKDWESLPEEFWESVLASLPLSSLFNALAVCKAWNRFIFSSRFWDMSLHHNSGQNAGSASSFPFFVHKKGRRVRVGMAYNPSLDRWQKLPSLFFPPSAQMSMNAGKKRDRYPLFGSQGVLCYAKGIHPSANLAHSYGAYTLTVFNIFTKWWVQVASLEGRPGFYSFQMLVTGDAEFKIFATNAFFDRGLLCVYDSCSGVDSWVEVPFPRCYEPPWAWESCRTTISTDKRFLYCLDRTPQKTDVIAYDINKQVWRDVALNVKRIHGCLITEWSKLMECDGLLYLNVMRSQSPPVLLLLNTDQQRWEQISTFPHLKQQDGSLWIPETSYHWYHSDACGCLADNGTLFYVVKDTKFPRHRWRILLYQVHIGSWRVVPLLRVFKATEYRLILSSVL